MGILSGLQPEKVFKYFEEICAIPHGSSDTKNISDYLVAFAKERNLKVIQDETQNVIIFKAGTDGYENSPAVMLQGHMDMVCEKTADCNIDFAKDGLRLKLQDGIISAEGTTLGGDDGIAVAYALAILDSEDIPHPPLECVFTVDEEIGMLGAAALDCSVLKSRILLNLDSEEEGHILVSCAGGATATAVIPVTYKAPTPESQAFKVRISGITGGHSGVEIIKQGANADKVLGRFLNLLMKKLSFDLVSVEGGLKDNAIPREALAIVSISLSDRENLELCAIELTNILKNEYGHTDADINIEIERAALPEKVMSEDSKRRVITSLFLMPNGIFKMSQDIEGLVQTSLNLGIMKTTDQEVSMSFSVRSSIASEKQNLMDIIERVAISQGGTLQVSGNYPGWQYKQDSPLRQLMIHLYKNQYGTEPVIEAIHAGLECGIFTDKIPGLDCVSFGPDMKDIHTTSETMDVASVARTWTYLLSILKELK